MVLVAFAFAVGVLAFVGALGFGFAAFDAIFFARLLTFGSTHFGFVGFEASLVAGLEGIALGEAFGVVSPVLHTLVVAGFSFTIFYPNASRVALRFAFSWSAAFFEAFFVARAGGTVVAAGLAGSFTRFLALFLAGAFLDASVVTTVLASSIFLSARFA